VSILTGGYVGAKACTQGPTVGAKNLIAWYLGGYKARGGTNLGIFNCRPVRGGTITSLHGEGRAADLGTPTSGQSWSWELADFLRLHSRELGIQCVIHNRKIWSSGGGAAWRPYTGVAPHFDHLHVELTWWAANGGLTVDLLNRSRRGVVAPVVVSSSVLRQGSKGPAVTRLQERLVKLYPAYAQTLGKLVVDGDFGPTTHKWVCEFQKRSRLPVDGVVGPNTARALGL
jgi:hypothetical protein